MAEIESRSRAKITAYTSALIIAVSSSVYLAVVPLLPASPVVPILVGFALGGLSMRNRGIAIASLYLLVYFSVLWQMIGFGFFQLLSAGVGIAVLLALAFPLVPFMTKRVELSSMALAVLAVALMLTPAWFLSIPLIAAASLTFGGFASLEALALTFIFFLTPFLLLENALYFTTTNGASAPILFGQFSLLSQNLRPPLPGLNILLTGLPANYLSHSAIPVSAWLSTSSGILVIPMVILGAILVAASSVGGVIRTMIERFEKTMEMTERIRLFFAPLVVGLVVPGMFILLLSLLSRPESGGFQTSLSNDPTHVQAFYMLGSSFLLTTSFIGRESLILRLENIQLGTEGLQALIDRCFEKIKDAQSMLDATARRVPSMSLSGERQAISEYSSYVADAQRQMSGASAPLVTQLQNQLETSVLQPLNKEPEVLRKRVASEIRGLISATATANNHLDQAGVAMRYQDISSVQDFSPMEDLISAYTEASVAIKGVTVDLSDLYSKEAAALDGLMGQQEVRPPVSASVLLDSNELVPAIRLVAEEYWLNFYLRWAEPIDQKKQVLLGRMKYLHQVATENENHQLVRIEAVIGEARPTNSAETLEALRELRAMLDDIVARASSGADRVGTMLESLELGNVRGLRFETVNRRGEVVELKKKLDVVTASFDSLAKFLENAAGVLASQSEAWKSDRDNLVVLAQYPLAKKIIDKMIRDQKALALAKLPFQSKASTMYARLYSAANPEYKYDENGERLVLREDDA